MKRWISIFVLVVLCCVPLMAVRAEEGASSNDLGSKIQQLQQKIGDLQSTENTLSKQISILNTNIELTTLKIDSIKAAVIKLSSEIDELNNEIDRLQTLMEKRSELVLHRVPETYRRSNSQSFGVFLFGKDISDFVSRIQYVEHVQKKDFELLFQLKSTQANFSERKDLRERKKSQQEELRAQLLAESRNLESQKKEKQVILADTKNSEATYQKLLAQAIAEQLAVNRAVANSVSVGPVKKGDPIALVGNSGYPGCSTGAHLHFEVHKNGQVVNAEGYLSGRDVDDDQNGGRQRIGSGGWDWPLEGDIVVTQHFGKTPYSYRYPDGLHHGVDMISNTSTVIRAPADGVLYSSTESCGGSSIIKIKYIEHPDGITSFYLHVQ